MNIQNVLISQIKTNEAALRTVDVESEKVLSIVKSIQAKGILQPPIVVEIPDDPDYSHLLVDGLHRYTCAKLAGLEEIPVSVQDLADTEQLEIQIMTNVHRVETKAVELSAGLNRMLATKQTLTVRELADKLCRPQSWITSILKVDKMPDSVKELIAAGDIKLLNALVLAKVKDEGEMLSLLEDAQTKTVQEFSGIVAERCKEIAKARKEGRETKPMEYVPVAKFRKVGDMKELQANPDFSVILGAVDAQTPQDGAKAMLDYVLNLDPASIEEGQNKFNARAEAKKAASEAKKAEAESRKLKKAQEKAEKANKEAQELARASEGNTAGGSEPA